MSPIVKKDNKNSVCMCLEDLRIKHIKLQKIAIDLFDEQLNEKFGIANPTQTDNASFA